MLQIRRLLAPVGRYPPRIIHVVVAGRRIRMRMPWTEHRCKGRHWCAAVVLGVLIIICIIAFLPRRTGRHKKVAGNMDDNPELHGHDLPRMHGNKGPQSKAVAELDAAGSPAELHGLERVTNELGIGSQDSTTAGTGISAT